MKLNSSKAATDNFSIIVARCVNQLAQHELVDRLLLAVNYETEDGRLYAVPKFNMEEDETSDPRFAQLTNILDQLKAGFGDMLKIHTFVINPSRLHDTITVCRRLGYEVRQLRFKRSKKKTKKTR